MELVINTNEVDQTIFPSIKDVKKREILNCMREVMGELPENEAEEFSEFFEAINADQDSDDDAANVSTVFRTSSSKDPFNCSDSESFCGFNAKVDSDSSEISEAKLKENNFNSSDVSDIVVKSEPQDFTELEIKLQDDLSISAEMNSFIEEKFDNELNHLESKLEMKNEDVCAKSSDVLTLGGEVEKGRTANDLNKGATRNLNKTLKRNANKSINLRRKEKSRREKYHKLKKRSLEALRSRICDVTSDVSALSYCEPVVLKEALSVISDLNSKAEELVNEKKKLKKLQENFFKTMIQLLKDCSDVQSKKNLSVKRIPSAKKTNLALSNIFEEPLSVNHNFLGFDDLECSSLCSSVPFSNICLKASLSNDNRSENERIAIKEVNEKGVIPDNNVEDEKQVLVQSKYDLRKIENGCDTAQDASNTYIKVNAYSSLDFVFKPISTQLVFLESKDSLHGSSHRKSLPRQRVKRVGNTTNGAKELESTIRNKSRKKFIGKPQSVFKSKTMLSNELASIKSGLRRKSLKNYRDMVNNLLSNPNQRDSSTEQGSTARFNVRQSPKIIQKSKSTKENMPSNLVNSKSKTSQIGVQSKILHVRNRNISQNGDNSILAIKNKDSKERDESKTTIVREPYPSKPKTRRSLGNFNENNSKETVIPLEKETKVSNSSSCVGKRKTIVILPCKNNIFQASSNLPVSSKIENLEMGSKKALNFSSNSPKAAQSSSITKEFSSKGNNISVLATSKCHKTSQLSKSTQTIVKGLTFDEFKTPIGNDIQHDTGESSQNMSNIQTSFDQFFRAGRFKVSSSPSSCLYYPVHPFISYDYPVHFIPLDQDSIPKSIPLYSRTIEYKNTQIYPSFVQIYPSYRGVEFSRMNEIISRNLPRQNKCLDDVLPNIIPTSNIKGHTTGYHNVKNLTLEKLNSLSSSCTLTRSISSGVVENRNRTAGRNDCLQQELLRSVREQELNFGNTRKVLLNARIKKSFSEYQSAKALCSSFANTSSKNLSSPPSEVSCLTPVGNDTDLSSHSTVDGSPTLNADGHNSNSKVFNCTKCSFSTTKLGVQKRHQLTHMNERDLGNSTHGSTSYNGLCFPFSSSGNLLPISKTCFEDPPKNPSKKAKTTNINKRKPT